MPDGPVADLRELDLSLDEIRRLLALREGCADAPEMAVRFGDVLATQLERTERRLAALKRLQVEFAATLEILKRCRTCGTGPGTEACAHCDVATGGEAPRIMRVVVGGGGRSGEGPPGE